MTENNKQISQHRVVDTGLIKDFNSPEADAIIRLQTNIDFASMEKKINCYAVTSAQEAEGKTTMSCNLALVYAEKGLKVCVLDLDLRQPAIHKLFHFENKVGLVDYVKGDAELEDIIHSCNGVDIISAGSHTPFPGKILGSVKMKELVEELKKKYDFVIMDTPPILVVSDAYLVGQIVDGFLVVCTQHVSKKKDVAAACKSLEEKRINVLGIAMTMVTTDEDYGKGGYGYATKYGYGYGYGYKGGYHSKNKSE
jgi:capsular exopolysaccharide synthesis family protein